MSNPPPPPQPEQQPPPPGYWQASDGNWYPPQGAVGPPQTPIGAAQTGIPGWAKGCLIAAVIVFVLGAGLIVLLGVVINEAVDEFNEQTGVASASDFDLELESCAPNEFGIAEASGLLTNTSTIRQGFEVEVRFFDADNVLVEQSVTFVDGIDPGQSSLWTISAFEEASGTLRCETQVSYTIFD